MKSVVSIIVCGAPNAGKSSLFNELIGFRVSAVSQKPQTTQQDLMVDGEFGGANVSLLDTPGIFRFNPTVKTKRGASTVAKSIDGRDIILVVIDIAKRNLDKELLLVDEILAQYDNMQGKFVIVFNKIDKISSAEVVRRAALFQEKEVSEFFMTSVKDKIGIDDLKECLVRLVAECDKGGLANNVDNDYGEDDADAQSAAAFPDAQSAAAPATQKGNAPTAPRHKFKTFGTQKSKSLVALAVELTREQIFQLLHEELPYTTKVEPVLLEKRRDGLHFYQNIIVLKPSQKRIVVGVEGSTLKTIGSAARLSIAQSLQRRVHLHLFVKIAKEKKTERRFS
jgi:GTP-binding protein Era